VHPPPPPDALVGSAFTLCYRGYCDHGRIRTPEPGSAPDFYTCGADGWGPSSLSPGCFVRAEGQGSTFEATVTACSPEARPNLDGDTVGLRLEHDGSRLVDHTRFVRYTGTYERRDLAPPVRVHRATVEIWPSSESGKTCESGDCHAGVHFEKIVTMTAEGAGMTTITACRNQDCASFELTLWNWGDGRGVPYGGGASMVGPFARFAPTIDYGPTGHGAYRLRLDFPGDTRLFTPGERFAVDWRADATGAVIMKADEIVTQYDETYPGGRDCTPVACRAKTFSLADR